MDDRLTVPEIQAHISGEGLGIILHRHHIRQDEGMVAGAGDTDDLALQAGPALLDAYGSNLQGGETGETGTVKFILPEFCVVGGEHHGIDQICAGNIYHKFTRALNVLQGLGLSGMIQNGEGEHRRLLGNWRAPAEGCYMVGSVSIPCGAKDRPAGLKCSHHGVGFFLGNL